MIKAFCDCCSKELKMETFRFEATVEQIMVDINNDLPAPQKKVNKAVYQVCETCYKKHLTKPLNGKEIKKTK